MSDKMMRIGTKSAAMKLMAEMKVHPVSKEPLRKMKYDNGKYTWKGQKEHQASEPECVDSGTMALWVEQRKDQYGTYCQVMCITD